MDAKNVKISPQANPAGIESAENVEQAVLQLASIVSGLSGGGGGGGGAETDPIYSADRPFIALKSEIEPKADKQQVETLSTLTSTALSTTNSAVASLSTSTSTALSATNSTAALLSTSTSTALSTTNSTVALLAQLPTGLSTQWYATTYAKQVSQTITDGSTVSIASLFDDTDRTSLLSDTNRVYKNAAGFFQIDPIGANTKEDIAVRLRLDVIFSGGSGTDLEFGVQLVRADGSDLGTLSYVKVQDAPSKPTRRLFFCDTFADGLLDPFYTQGFDIRILTYSGQVVTINNVAESVQFKIVRNPEILQSFF